MKGLTPRQAQLFAIIRRHIQAHGSVPSRAELADLLGIKSRGAVNGLIDRLEERGFLRRAGHGARGLELVEQADRFAPGVEANISAYCQRHRVPRETAVARAVECFFGGAA